MTQISPTDTVRIMLGPTNTGKTHYAVERMLAHQNGMIGLPLRLLAREIYDRIVAMRGAGQVALITGEEKIAPKHARYYVCTTESMPVSRGFDFLCIDEIQLAGDPERGHVFTDRLLKARGRQETLFLGSDIMRQFMRRLFPGVEIQERPRLSRLTWAGRHKISRLPRRAAIVAFSTDDVYALAELIRRQRGGAAVVLGALSPRARNRQVELYQNGDVDYMVATDAIGMGLNMDLDHVSFAALWKFDGQSHRRLTVSEMAQIAGRAGRFQNDGTFGTTQEVEPLEEEVIEKIENHQFDPLKLLSYRNSRLDFSSVESLLASLDAPSPHEGLVRLRDASDYQTLRFLIHDKKIRERLQGVENIELLWDCCQIPDFRRAVLDDHASLISTLFCDLNDKGKLRHDWIARQVERIDKPHGEIDALTNRLAHVRTWSYISHRVRWLDDPNYWQQACREVEDRLSDALHEALTNRFVDRRSGVLLKRLKGRGAVLLGHVDTEGVVNVEGVEVGHLNGFVFETGNVDDADEKARLLAAARRTLEPEITKRVKAVEESKDPAFLLDRNGKVTWNDAEVGRLVAGASVLHPQIEAVKSDLLDEKDRERIRKRVDDAITARLKEVLAPLYTLEESADLSGPARGLAFTMCEHLGALSRYQAPGLTRDLSQEDKQAVRALGVRLGPACLYMPTILKQQASYFRGLLWAVKEGLDDVPEDERLGLSTFDVKEGVPEGYYEAAGYRVLSGRAIRLDTIDRLSRNAEDLARSGPFVPPPEFAALVGAKRDDLPEMLKALGFRQRTIDDEVKFISPRDPSLKEEQKKRQEARKQNNRGGTGGGNAAGGKGRGKGKGGNKPANAGANKSAPKKDKPMDPDSPFAALAALKNGLK